MAHKWILAPEFVAALPQTVAAGELPFHQPNRFRHDSGCEYTVNERYDIILYCIYPNNAVARPSTWRQEIRRLRWLTWHSGQQLLQNYRRDYKYRFWRGDSLSRRRPALYVDELNEYDSADGCPQS